MTERRERDGKDDCADLLSDVSRSCAGRDAEQDILEAISRQTPGEDAPLNMGEGFSEAREQKGLSLEDISHRTGIDVSMLARIEQGTVTPPLGTVVKLAKAFEMKMGYFISGKEDRAYTIVRGDDRKVVARYNSRQAQYYG